MGMEKYKERFQFPPDPRQQIETAIKTIDLLTTFIGERALHTFFPPSLEPKLPIANASSSSASKSSAVRRK